MLKLIAIAGVFSLVGCGENREAVAICKQAILDHVKNPSLATIPEPSSVLKSLRGIGVEWEVGDGLLLQNDMGAKVERKASCDVVDGKARSLYVGHELLIAPPELQPPT